MDMMAEALWSQRQPLYNYAKRLGQLRDTVRSPSEFSIPQWAHLYANRSHPVRLSWALGH